MGDGLVAAGKRTERRAEVEEAILRSARALIDGGSPYSALSVERVSRDAGIGRTAFYFYFRDKRELLMRLTVEVVEILYQQADRWWHGTGEDPDAEIRVSLTEITRLYLENSHLLRAVTEASMHDDEVRAFWNAVIGRFITASRERIEADLEAGRVTGAIDPFETSSALCWMTERRLYQLARDGGDADAVVDALTQIFMRSVYGSLPPR